MKTVKDQQTILLDPGAHPDSVNFFMDFFNLQSKQPVLNFLQEILQYFSNIPYENISKIIKLNKSWDSQNKIRLPEEVIDDYIVFKLGGTCFSLTFFLQSILTQNGYFCYPVMADMSSGKNVHCCLVVILNGVKYLVDPGYLLTKPMEINPQKNILFKKNHAGVELRFDPESRFYNLYTFGKNNTKWRYRFKEAPVSPEEFSGHWLNSFRWNPMHRIYITKIINGELIYVRDYFMRKTNSEGRYNFNIKRNYHTIINETFGIDKQIIEQARGSLKENLEKERDLGLWVPE